jgi:hypothetical protein
MTVMCLHRDVLIFHFLGVLKAENQPDTPKPEHSSPESTISPYSFVNSNRQE